MADLMNILSFSHTFCISLDEIYLIKISLFSLSMCTLRKLISALEVHLIDMYKDREITLIFLSDCYTKKLIIKDNIFLCYDFRKVHCVIYFKQSSLIEENDCKHR